MGRVHLTRARARREDRATEDHTGDSPSHRLTAYADDGGEKTQKFFAALNYSRPPHQAHQARRIWLERNDSASMRTIDSD